MDNAAHRSGFIAVVGRPNVGKSTLINSLIGQKIAIMSDKPQTTRTRILCILTQPDAQVVLLDTPGVHKPFSRLGEYMERSVLNTLKEVDAVLFVADVTEKPGPGERYIMGRLEKTKKPVVLVLNKIDLVKRGALLPLMDTYSKMYPFSGIVPVSALSELNLDALLGEAKKYLPEGPSYYPEEMVTDQPERLIAAELVREKALQLTRDEVPHAIAVDVEEMTARPQGGTYIRATVYVERDSQKGILIGHRGSMLREIGRLARADIEMMLGGQVYLDLWVKVRKDWKNRDAILKSMGFGKD